MPATRLYLNVSYFTSVLPILPDGFVKLTGIDRRSCIWTDYPIEQVEDGMFQVTYFDLNSFLIGALNEWSVLGLIFSESID
jgi:hypothetical protein